MVGQDVVVKPMSTAEKMKVLRRRYPRPKDRENCYVCDQWKQITEWHHAPAIEDVARLAVRVALILESKIDWPMYALCPNHHAIIHTLVRHPAFKRGKMPTGALRRAGISSKAQQEAIRTILRREAAAWRELERLV